MEQKEVRYAPASSNLSAPMVQQESGNAQPSAIGTAQLSSSSTQIRSMRTYIEQHYGEAILTELEKKINSGEIPHRIDRGNRCPKRVHACSGTGQIQKITFHRFPGDEVCAEIVMTMRVAQTYTRGGFDVVETLTQRYRVDMWITIDDEIICDYSDFRNDYGKANEEGQLLSEYLIPYFSREDIEREAESILFALCPNALRQPELINAANMIRLLGLHVMYLPLYQCEKTQSILFFADGEVTVAHQDGSPHKKHISADTIVLNLNYPGACYENAVFHECFHHVEHQLFFKLQKAASADVSMLPKWEPTKKQKADDNPIEWMEWQARYGSQCMQMPKSMVQERVNALLQEMKNWPAHDGMKMERVGKKLASVFNVSWYRARNRLIQSGYGAARGALNCVNGRYVRPYAFSLDACRGSQTFLISIKDAMREYVRNEAFCKQLDSGRYVYVEGHFCLNEPEYVRYIGRELYMTDWANAHVDQCCLRFVVNYTRDELRGYKYGQLNSDDEYNGRYLTLTDNESPEKVMKYAQKISKDLLNLPVSFHETLKSHMKRCKIPIEKLSEFASISDRTIKRLRTEERNEYSLDQVMAICVALHLPPEYSFDLIKKAGLVLRDTPDHLIYRMILQTMYKSSIGEVQAALRECGCAPLRLVEPDVERKATREMS